MRAEERTDTALERSLESASTGPEARDGRATTDCFDAAQWHEYSLQAIDETLREAMQQHLPKCAVCRAELSMASAFEAPETEAEKQSVDAIARRVSESLVADSEATVVAFPASQTPMTAPVRWGKKLAIAASLLLVTAVSFMMWIQRGVAPDLAAPGGSGVVRSEARLVLEAPLAEQAAAPMRFAWSGGRSQNGRYLVQVRRVDGRVVLEREVEGSELVLGEADRSLFEDFVTYRWSVESTERDGNGALTSTVGEFLIRPNRDAAPSSPAANPRGEE